MLAMHSPNEIAALVPMPEMLRALGFKVTERTRRSACLLHGGSNRSAFSWTEAGLWRCHSCGAGGDRIALVQAVRHCGFREALEFLGQVAGVEYSPRRACRRTIERARIDRERADSAAWRIRDEVIRLGSYYRDGLHRTERLMARIGDELLRSCRGAERDAIWERLARLAPAQTFFLAAYDFHSRASVGALVRLALASPPERRCLIFGEDDGNIQLQAA